MSDNATEIPAVPAVDLDALADKVVSRLKGAPPTADYQLLAFSIVGTELRATVRTPSNDVYQGVVTNWEKVTVVEVPK